MSAGSFWRSPSMGDDPCPGACSNPAASAADWPSSGESSPNPADHRRRLILESRVRPVGAPVVHDDHFIRQGEFGRGWCRWP